MMTPLLGRLRTLTRLESHSAQRGQGNPKPADLPDFGCIDLRLIIFFMWPRLANPQIFFFYPFSVDFHDECGIKLER